MVKLSAATAGLSLWLLADSVSVVQTPKKKDTLPPGIKDSDFITKANTTNSTKSKSISCTCITWKVAYDQSSFKAKCGKGWELYEWHKRFEMWGKVTHKWEKNICLPWFQSLDANFCMRYEPKEGSNEWCYVDKRCEGAMGVSGRPVGIKNCSAANGDQLAESLRPDELNWLAKKYKVPTAMIARYAYSLAPEPFEEIRDYWEKKWPLTPLKAQAVEMYKHSGKYWMFEGDKNYPNISVIHGNSLWVMEPRPEERTGFEWICRKECGTHGTSH